MNKKIIIMAAIAVVILASATFVYLIFSPSGSSKAESESESVDESDISSSAQAQGLSSSSVTTEPDVAELEADELVATFGLIGEPYTLHSRYYKQGDVITEDVPNLGWDGDMLLTVNSAKISEYGEEVDIIETWDMGVSQFNLNLQEFPHL